MGPRGDQRQERPPLHQHEIRRPRGAASRAWGLARSEELVPVAHLRVVAILDLHPTERSPDGIDEPVRVWAMYICGEPVW